MKQWDVFCKIVDNFGDIGVCWRLSQQLANEHQLNVRLFIDDFRIASNIIPMLDVSKPIQTIHHVEIHAWPTHHIELPDVVVENFSCELPDCYAKQISVHNKQCAPKDMVVWINLEYLSAEQWVEDCHTLPSIHPSLGYTRYFFYPGFTQKTGGLIRECDLIPTRENFANHASARQDFLSKCLKSIPPITSDTKIISLFCYPQANIKQLIASLASINQEIHLLLPFNSEIIAIKSIIEQYQLSVFHSQRINQLSLHVLPFLAQKDYDKLLWACDLNFVRGEDSWIRAIWSGQPFIWQPYIQAENTHLKKLDAFLSQYLAEPSDALPIIRQAHDIWSNAVEPSPDVWQTVLSALPTWRHHSQHYANEMAKQTDLSSQLVTFALQIHNKHKKRNSV